MNTSRLSGEKIKLSDIRTNVMRHSQECLMTVARMKMKLKHQSQAIFSKVDQNSGICRINIHSMGLQRESCVYIVNLCRELVSSEIGALVIWYLKVEILYYLCC